MEKIIMNYRIRSCCLFLSIFVMILLGVGCDEDSPTAPSPGATQTPSATATAMPTETPGIPTTTPTPEPEVFYGTLYDEDSGSQSGSINYSIFSDHSVSGRITVTAQCHHWGSSVPDQTFHWSFETVSDDSGKFEYEYSLSTSPHWGIFVRIGCTKGGDTSDGSYTWSSLEGGDISCISQGTWTAACNSGC